MNPQLILWLGILAISINNAQGILNGKIAVNEDFRYQVFLKSGNDEDDDVIPKSCGGVILDELHILTAAHCVYDVPVYDITVYAGTYRLEVDDVVIGDVIKVHIPRDFELGHEDTDDDLQLSYRDKSDIAVLTLFEPLILGSRIQAIPLTCNDVFCAKYCQFSGWGATAENSSEESRDLLWHDAMILAPSYCKKLGSAHRNNEFCALDILEKSTPLKGDSGGGLVCDGVLVGILSTGTGDVHVPAIYMNVYKFLTFINEEISRDEEEQPIKKKRKL